MLTFVETISNMAHFVPTKTTATAADTLELLANRLVRYHGVPAVLVSDRDVQFVSELWSLFCTRFKVRRALSSSWHTTYKLELPRSMQTHPVELHRQQRQHQQVLQLIDQQKGELSRQQQRMDTKQREVVKAFLMLRQQQEALKVQQQQPAADEVQQQQ
ncbi:hypothetical protein EBH_0065780 [Eimeria brunetti]|uniref:Integrase catalytic domain-containing protein n=1 Tax=Eimeria brunetti TaxID=51314 RepID=U6LZL7_9EIME|nr:hypothetical protein EBH_0065780 [Eimeria brunetti]